MTEKNLSGKFVLRIPPKIHGELKDEAYENNISLNQLIINRLLLTQDKKGLEKSHLMRPFIHPEILSSMVSCWNPVGILQFGSSVRGEMGKNSDIDLLIILPEETPLKRKLYKEWDILYKNFIKEKKADKTAVSVHFTHLPQNFETLSVLWPEVAIEGQWQYCSSLKAMTVLTKIRNLVAHGEYIRKTAHGQPYWVRRRKDIEK